MCSRRQLDGRQGVPEKNNTLLLPELKPQSLRLAAQNLTTVAQCVSIPAAVSVSAIFLFCSSFFISYLMSSGDCHFTFNPLKSSGHYMYSPVVTICTVQWSLYVQSSGHYMYSPVVTICTVQWSIYVQSSGHYMYSPVVTICTTSLTFNNCTLCPHCIYVFCIYLRTNSDLCHLQHKLIGFYN